MDVLLFRTPSESDPYDAAFASAGYRPRSVQALDDVLLPEGLAPILAAGGGRWEAALITSRRAAEAWCLAVKDAQRYPSENFGTWVADETLCSCRELSVADTQNSGPQCRFTRPAALLLLSLSLTDWNPHGDRVREGRL